MNVLLVYTIVIKSVQTLMAPLPVPVTVDIHCQVIADHALVMVTMKDIIIYRDLCPTKFNACVLICRY